MRLDSKKSTICQPTFFIKTWIVNRLNRTKLNILSDYKATVTLESFDFMGANFCGFLFICGDVFSWMLKVLVSEGKLNLL